MVCKSFLIHPSFSGPEGWYIQAILVSSHVPCLPLARGDWCGGMYTPGSHPAWLHSFATASFSDTTLQPQLTFRVLAIIPSHALSGLGWQLLPNAASPGVLQPSLVLPTLLSLSHYRTLMATCSLQGPFQAFLVLWTGRIYWLFW